MFIFRDDQKQRLFRGIDIANTNNNEEAGVEAYDIETMGPIRTFIAKKLGVPYQAADGKMLYLNKRSLNAFLKRNQSIIDNTEYSQNTYHILLQDLQSLVMEKAEKAFDIQGDFRIAEEDFEAVLRGLGMDEKNTQTFLRTLAAYKHDSKEAAGLDGLQGSEPKEFVIIRGTINDSEIQIIVKSLREFCRPDPELKSTLHVFIKNFNELSREP